MAAQTADAVTVLNQLILACDDASEGFRKAAQDAEESSLKTLFAGYSAERERFAAELRTAVAAHGGKPQTSEHAGAALRRGWMGLKEIIGNKDKAIIDECEAGEDDALKAYRSAAEKQLPGVLGEIINRQYAAVQEAHNRVRELKHSRH